jgi:hypothetical protein
MNRKLPLTLIAALVLGAPAFAASPTSGSGTESRGEIGFGVGQSDVGADEIGVDSAQFLGLRGGYNFNPQFQVEGQFSKASENGDVAGTGVDSTIELYMVNAVLNFHPPKKEFVPYVMAGVGRADVSVDAGSVSASDNSTAYQIGGGTRVYFGESKRMAFRADVSMMKESTFDDNSTITTFTGGLTFRLGGR